MSDTINLDKVKRLEKAPRCLSTPFFCSTISLFITGIKRQLSEEDLLHPLKSQKSKYMGDALAESWKKEITNYKHPSLWRALFRMFMPTYSVLVLITLVTEISKILQTLALGELMIYYTSSNHEVSKEQAYVYATAIAGLSIFHMLTMHILFIRLYYLGINMIVATSSLIYQKSLRLSRSALNDYSAGNIVNLLSNDISRFEKGVICIHYIFLAPIILGIFVYVMYTFVGLAACAGMASFLLYVPLQMYFGKKIAYCRAQTAVKTDERVRLMNEIISGIKVIKMYTWEKPFAIVIARIRKLEINQIRNASHFRGTILAFTVFSTRFAAYISIILYVLLGNQINAYYVFVVIAMYNSMKVLMTELLPKGLTGLGELYISVKRIQELLLAEEIEPTFKETRSVGERVRISMMNLTAKWSESSSDNTLSDINLTVAGEELVAIVGHVGSGKSSLLQVILNELPKTRGEIDVRGNVSYAAQEPWIFTGTVRQNVLFGKEMNTERYNKVVRVCTLERDFKTFPYGDNTIVGERGILLSGGQKARICLARAVYKEADIYLLDDPLSAVDTNVGKQLFEEGIRRFLKRKCVILVTHQLQYLANVNRIVVLENGTITAEGSYGRLSEQGHFGTLLLKKEDTDEEEVITSTEDVDIDKVGETEIKEHMSHGGLTGRVYEAYINSGGGTFMFSALFILFLLTQIFVNLMDYFTTFWLNLEETREKDVNSTTNKDFLPTDNLISLYTCITILMIAIALSTSYAFYNLCMKASNNLHNSMFSKIVYATMFFFNTTPSGRILNRFSKDMGSVDEMLPLTLGDALQGGLSCFAIVIMTVILNYWLIFPVTLLGFAIYIVRVMYIATSRSIKRMEGVTKSPVFTHLNATIQGITTVRAFGVQQLMKNQFDNYQNKHTSAYYTFVCCARSFGFWIDAISTVYIIVVTYSFLLLDNESSAGNVGLAITKALGLTSMVQFGMRQWTEFENYMTSVERIVEYTELRAEAVDEGKSIEAPWPQQGKIEFKSVSMRYSEEGPYVLKDLSFSVDSREKVGIVGRTGAGKSSLIAALFLLNDIEGEVIIDGVSTKETSLQILRSKISTIPQEPVLFSGTLRKNLDPFDEYPDPELWNALEEVELKQAVADFPSGLDHRMSEGGSNFSVGQRQLICLARAIIRKNNILVMDEATANVDGKTDELIQKTIRRKFADCTVLTIAHRLHTIMDSDKVLVMDEGKAVEYGHPYLLLQNSRGVFYGLLQQTGKGMSEDLTNIARQNYECSHLSSDSNAGN